MNAAHLVQDPPGIGHNHPPDDDLDFITARVIEEAAHYLRFLFREVEGLEKLLVKRAGARPMGYRFVLCYSLRGIAPAESMARILGVNRKTMGENMARPEVWSNHDSEEGRAFDDALEHVAQAVYHHVSVKVSDFDRLLLHFVGMDPDLRRLEKQGKAHELAALEAERAAQALEEKKRLRKLASLRKTLRGNPNADAILAQHEGARETAGKLSPQALAVIEALVTREAKGVRLTASALDAAGLKEAVRLGLARNAEPYLSQAKDPQYAHTAFGGRVYLEAIALDLLSKPKPKRKA